MNKKILLLGLGAFAIYYFTRKKNRGIIEVQSPEKITEKEFLKPSIVKTRPRPKNVQKYVTPLVEKATPVILDKVRNFITKKGTNIFAKAEKKVGEIPILY